MTIILGVDPGSRITGYAVIEAYRSRYVYLTSGIVRVKGETLSDKLTNIYQNLRQIIQTYHPEEAAIEKIFMHQNPNSALKLGQARGAAIVAAHTIPVAEYSARQIKQAIAGYGAATKEQVQYMVRLLLKLKLTTILTLDASDALAVALCHANTREGSITALISKNRLLTSTHFQQRK